MSIENSLTRKILDPIHGIIRLTALEIAFINHPLFQRLRNIKQNSFLYKVFPSAVHSRFEHSLGVLHLSNEVINNLRLNAIRYNNKYDDGHIFCDMEKIPDNHIQELRLAALLHDVGHGPMSHQFDSFLPSKEEFKAILGSQYQSILDVIDKKVEHEHISLLFTLLIYHDVIKDESLSCSINIENTLKIIDKNYGDGKIIIEIEGGYINILPLLTSIISSCPIDADRMDYLLRDGYFSGVKCGVYDYNRLFMSIVPVKVNDEVFLAYKESGVDSIVEFISSRSSLFSQVYYHKTNRSLSAMLAKICQDMREQLSEGLIVEDISLSDDNKINALKELYITCSDDYFLNEKLGEWIDHTDTIENNKQILDDIINRRPWSKVYETKYSNMMASIVDEDDKVLAGKIRGKLTPVLNEYFGSNGYVIDIVSDVMFKDILKTKVKLLVKNINNSYEIRDLADCGDKLDQHQCIKYVIRVFVNNKDGLSAGAKQKVIGEIDTLAKNEIEAYSNPTP